jgi:hypothetical protein
MKTIVFLLLIVSTLGFTPSKSISKEISPKNVACGETFQKVEKQFSNYHFKFYKKTETNKSEISFAMLGYWDINEGYVLLFFNDKLMNVETFLDLDEYLMYITNPEEKNNIEINKNNLSYN